MTDDSNSFRSGLTAPDPPTVLIAHPGAELYGSDRMTLDTVRALTSEGWKVVVTLPAHGPLVPEIRATGAEVHVIGFPVLRKSALRPRGMFGLLAHAIKSALPSVRLIRSTGADVVYVSTVTLPFWVLISKLCRRGVLCHVHEAEVGAHRILRKLLTAQFRLADTIVGNSAFTLDSLRAEQPRLRAKTLIILNSLVRPGAVVQPREHLDAPVKLLYVGRLSPRKGAHHAVAALAAIRAQGIDAELSLLGDVFEGYEWFDSELRELASSNGMLNKVAFLGFRDDVWSTIDDADVVVVPSVDPEGFGNTAVEAVLAARPLVASTAGGLAEAIDGYDSVVPVTPGSVEELIDGIDEVLANWSVFRERALSNLAVAQERHSLETYGTQMRDAIAATLTGAV